jgi:hypothetical protein
MTEICFATFAWSRPGQLDCCQIKPSCEYDVATPWKLDFLNLVGSNIVDIDGAEKRGLPPRILRGHQGPEKLPAASWLRIFFGFS